MSDYRLRLGFIGAGGIVKERHLPGFRAIDGVDLVAVCNRTPESTRRVADEWGIANCLEDWRDIIRHPEVDAVVIGTWPYMHSEMSIEILHAGKPVFCQARMARDADEARLMRDAQRASGKVAMLCPPPMGLKWDRTMRRLLAEGFVGNVLTVRVTSMHGRYLDPHAPLTWRQDHNLSGLNVLTLGIYAEVVRRWFGDHRSVQATSQTLTPRRVDPTSGLLEPVQIPDAVWVHAELDSGAIVQYSLSGIAHAAPTDRIEVYGSEGTLIYDFVTETIQGVRKDQGDLKELAVLDDESCGWEVELDFVRAVRGEKPPQPSFEDGVAYMDVVDATARSCRSGHRISLPLGD